MALRRKEDMKKKRAKRMNSKSAEYVNRPGYK
jgi:hypothetical protein